MAVYANGPPSNLMWAAIFADHFGLIIFNGRTHVGLSLKAKNTPKGSGIPNPAASGVLPVSGLLDSDFIFLFPGTMYQEPSFLPPLSLRLAVAEACGRIFSSYI